METYNCIHPCFPRLSYNSGHRSSPVTLDRERYIASYRSDWGSEYEKGGLIFSDRYTTSNMIHQGSKINNQEEKEGDNKNNSEQNEQKPQDPNDKKESKQDGERSESGMTPQQQEAVLQAVQAEEDKTQDKLKEKAAVLIKGGKNW